MEPVGGSKGGGGGAEIRLGSVRGSRNVAQAPPVEAWEGDAWRHVVTTPRGRSSGRPQPQPSLEAGIAPPPNPGIPGPKAGEPPRLLDRVRHAIRLRQYSRRTEEAYVFWIRRFIVFHGERHPSEMGSSEVTTFLSDLAVRRSVSVSTQNQAFSALLFLYRAVLRQDIAGLDQIVRAKRSQRVPLVLSRSEVSAVLGAMSGTPWLMASLIYGAGLRLLECARLRVKDVDFGRGEITVRDGKGRKDRVTMLPSPLAEPLRRHLATVSVQHAADLKAGLGTVEVPGALRAKYPNAESEWAWQWVFPAARFYTCLPSGPRRRHHLHESVLQRAFREAVSVTRLAKPASCHTLRHCAGYRIMPGGTADRLRIGGSSLRDAA